MADLFHFNFLKHKDKAKKSGEEHREMSEGGRPSKLSNASSSETTLLVNKTDKTLVLRDRVGAAYASARFKIPARSEMQVTRLEHTFFKMIAYAIEEEEGVEDEEGGEHSSHDEHHQGSHHKEVGERSSQEAHHQGSHQKKKIKMGVDTKLTIDSDKLADSKKIVIYWDEDESKYKIHCTAR